MTPENKKTMIWTAGVVVGLIIVAGALLLMMGTPSN